MNNNHKDILDELAKVCEQYPNQRFGQILFNYTAIGRRAGLGKVEDPFHIQDKEFLKSVKGY